jgi:hypothetical protein
VSVSDNRSGTLARVSSFTGGALSPQIRQLHPKKTVRQIGPSRYMRSLLRTHSMAQGPVLPPNRFYFLNGGGTFAPHGIFVLSQSCINLVLPAHRLNSRDAIRCCT